MPCPTADLKLALSSFLRVQFHGCHFALGVGAFLTPQCGFYKFHQPAPAPAAAAVFKQQHNNKTPVPAYYMLLMVKEWHLPPLLPAKDGPPQQAGGNRHAAIWLMAELYSTYQASAIDHVYTMANRGLFKHAWNWQASTPKWTHLTRRRSKTSGLNVPIAIYLAAAWCTKYIYSLI